MAESDLYGELMIEATRLGHRLFRNQIGRAKYKSAQGDVFTVPYGVGGVGGSDLIGWTFQPRLVRPGGQSREGTPFYPARAIFTALECKVGKKKPTAEQEKFLAAVRAAGGISGVVTSIADYHKLIGHNP